MDVLNNSSRGAGMKEFDDAAHFLGLDTFTFYSLVQREEIPLEFGPSGEFLIAQDHLDGLTGKEPSHVET